jgi:hypothetical protein
MIPELSTKKNIGGLGIDLDYLNTIETFKYLQSNSKNSFDTRSNLLTLAYGHSFRHNDNILHSIGVSTKVDFYNQKIHFTDNADNINDEYYEREDKYVEQRYMVDLSYGLRIFNGIQLSLILHNLPLEMKAHHNYWLQFLAPVSYTFFLSDKNSLTPEISYQFNDRIYDHFHYFSVGSELSIQKILFLRLGLTLKLEKLNYSEFDDYAKRFETDLNYSTGAGLNLLKRLSIDLFYKNRYGCNYFGFTTTLHDISDLSLIK